MKNWNGIDNLKNINVETLIIWGKEDNLKGLKENVIIGHLIPAGTGIKKYQDLIIGSKKEYNLLFNK